MESYKKQIRPDYLNEASGLTPFYQYSPNHPDFSEIIKRKSAENIDRKALHEVICQQYQGLSISEKTRQNIELLKEDNTFTVTTGHQIVLFGGPLFTLYKVLTIIKLAENLKQEYPQYNFVPIFWIHTEDHDFEEINHFFVDFQHKHTYQGSFRGRVGAHLIDDSIKDLYPLINDERCKAAYQPGKKFAAAYRQFMNDWLGKYGIVMLDPDNAHLKPAFSGIISSEIKEQLSYHQVSTTSFHLTQAGYPAQISPREINLFYMKDDLRNRIEQHGEKFQVLDSELSFQYEEIANLAHQNPEFFSPNVSLRPLYQEMILPNLAYVGGWGELSYWLQLKGLFDKSKTNFPLLLPRMSATLFTKEEETLWRGMGFELEDIDRELHVLYRKYMPTVWEDHEFTSLSKSLAESFSALEQYVYNYSDTLPRSVVGQKVKTDRFLANMKKKMHRVMRDRHHKPFAQIHDLKQQIQPDRKKQERVLNAMAFKGISLERIAETVWNYVDPLDFSPRYIVLD